MAVDTVHPDYIDGMRAIKICQDVFRGQAAIKATLGGLTPYFPMYNPPDLKRYERSIKLSSFTNFTGATVNKLVGAAFREPVTQNLEKNESIKYLLEDSDGSGGDLEQTATNCVLQNTIAGRHGLLVNYPATAGKTYSREEIKALDLKASIIQYPAKSIINWGMKDGSLDYVVLVEFKRKENGDMFSHAGDKGYRVYYMHEKKCLQQFLMEGENFIAADGEEITNAKSVALDYIPFIIIGSVDNTPTIDMSPITGMCDVNVAHYQLSVIETENLAIHGQMTLGVSTTLSVKDFEAANPNGIAVGANKGINLGEGGSFHTATIEGSTALPEAKESKKQEMIAIGASLTEKSVSTRTATEAKANNRSEVSIMTNVVNNVSDALEVCIDWCEEMMSASPKGDAQYEISTEFFDQTITPEQFTAFLNGLDRNLWHQSEILQIKQQSYPTVEMDTAPVVLELEEQIHITGDDD